MHFSTNLSAPSLLIPPVLSAPAPTVAGIARAGRLIDSLDALLQVIDGVDPVHNAWDYENIDSACSVQMYTSGGANCEVTIRCKDYEKKYSGSDFGVCHQNGQQAFIDPAIGEFSVNWTNFDRETLSEPELRVLSIGEGATWDVAALAIEGENSKQSYAPPKICNRLPEGFKFARPREDNMRGESIYECGVPRLGSVGAGGRDMLPETAPGYAGPWCGMHVTQHQKPIPGVDQYRFDITLYDSNEQEIGKVLNAEAGQTIGVTSMLPHVLLVDGGAVDEDAVLFRYGDQAWSSNDQAHQCNFGSYDNMKREGDCGFSC